MPMHPQYEMPPKPYSPYSKYYGPNLYRSSMADPSTDTLDETKVCGELSDPRGQ